MSDRTRSFSWVYLIWGIIILLLALGLSWAYLQGSFQSGAISTRAILLGSGGALYAGAVWLFHLAFFPCKPVTQSVLALLIGAGVGIATFAFWLRLEGIA